MPRRTPRRPSIGFASCIRLTAAKIAASRAGTSSPIASRVAMWAESSARGGKNSCNGGSSNRTVTGNPDIAIMMPTKSARCNGSISAITAR